MEDGTEHHAQNQNVERVRRPVHQNFVDDVLNEDRRRQTQNLQKERHEQDAAQLRNVFGEDGDKPLEPKFISLLVEFVAAREENRATRPVHQKFVAVNFNGLLREGRVHDVNVAVANRGDDDAPARMQTNQNRVNEFVQIFFFQALVLARLQLQFAGGSDQSRQVDGSLLQDVSAFELTIIGGDVVILCNGDEARQARIDSVDDAAFLFGLFNFGVELPRLCLVGGNFFEFNFSESLPAGFLRSLSLRRDKFFVVGIVIFIRH